MDDSCFSFIGAFLLLITPNPDNKESKNWCSVGVNVSCLYHIDSCRFICSGQLQTVQKRFADRFTPNSRGLDSQ